MKVHHTIVTRKGQVTIPAEVRRLLHLHEGDTVAWVLEENEVRLRRSRSVVARTAGLLRHASSPATPQEERAAAEAAIAEEAARRSDQ